jgi:vacuolar-type H+-ATPase subunit H
MRSRGVGASHEPALGNLALSRRLRGGQLPPLSPGQALGNRALLHLIRTAEAGDPAGQLLPPGVRTDMERSLGEDLGDVRVHSGPEADQAAHAMEAAAFTIGRDVVFGAGQYRPDSLGGRLVLAHELAHVVQQRGGVVPPLDTQAPHEVDASRAAVAAVLGRPAAVQARTGVSMVRITLPEVVKMLALAEEQMKTEGKWKNLVGAAGEGSYMGALTNRGVPNVNVNEFSSSMNTPYLDVVSAEGMAQVKVRDTGATLGKARLDDYVEDFQRLVDPELSGSKPAKVIKLLDKNRGELIKRGAWPKGLDPAATPDEILKFMQERSTLAIPADHVAAVRQEVATWARAHPEHWGLKPGPDLEAQIERLTARIESVGLARESLATLESNFRAGKTTLPADVKEPIVAPEPPTGAPEVAAQPAGGPSAGGPTAEPAAAAGAKVPGEPAVEPVVKVPGQPTVDPAQVKTPGEPTTPAEAPINEGAAPEPPSFRARLGRLGGFAGKWGGRALAAYAAWAEFKRLKTSDHGWGESLLGSLGMGAGFLGAGSLLKTAPKGAGAADLVINLANLGLHLAGAPRGVTDVSSTVASATPSSFIGSVVSQGGRAWYNIIRGTIKGDAADIDKQVKEMQRGSAGAPLQGYALTTELIADVAAGKGLESSIMRVGSIGQDTSVARIGNTLGSSAFVLGEVGKNLAKGDSLEKAVMKAPTLTGDTKWIQDTGERLGNEAYQFINKDLPEAKEFAKKDVAKVVTTVETKVDEAKQLVVDTVNVAREKGAEIKDEVVDTAKAKLEAAKALARKYLPW